MKTFNLFILLTLLLGLLSCKPQLTTNQDKLMADSLMTIMADAWNSKDTLKLQDLYTKDVVFISGTTTFAPRDTLLNAMKRIMIPNLSNFKWYPASSSLTDDLLYAEQYYSFNWNTPNYKALAKGTMIVVWQKQPDKMWKIIFTREQHGDLPIK